jgi:MFS family permease
MLATAGILYANVGPVIVSGLALADAFNPETAGYVFSTNMYGSAIGGFAIIFFVRHLSWRPAAIALVVLLLGIDLGSAWTNSSTLLYPLRFLHGLVGGALIGVGLSVIARTTHPERTFAILIMIQLLLGGFGVAWLTPLLDSLGVRIVWLALVGFTALTLLLIPLLDRYPVMRHSSEPEVVEHDQSAHGRAPWRIIFLAMAALFIFQAGQLGVFAYMIELGTYYQLTPELINLTVAFSLWVGVPTALAVAWWSTRSGRLLPVCIGMAGTTCAVALLLLADATAFAAANLGFGIFFSIGLPYLLGIAAEMDSSGQMAAAAGFISSLGLATGPALAALIVGSGQLEYVVVLAVCLLATSVILIIRPASALDRENRHGRVHW